ncbi:hypothetical protein A2763_00935 [Candidatus Kaiserbacteria bacterium RIFCSPHIGHO2_01_FULL_54_36]|uniref:Uncharacterized protein n=1 Tax=Candidatus Kaiserbacteria bacterium RIFCSPHIGHO2_01_FULL_54_36 TaxID=1798482 RepID=A0A1F6CNZ1_9BACT|nr:MAG: hypothetical protein A2763_00935 [Candidatus Kaiserbacteria bacterium RIFCSPHIGHO2_01_FULL_54_36]OGG75588.1 MAG: hypothetical protein A3A41_03140 [Candidatus Kaiserbacteria bacterium RIFCSPLOWO2_01_FULL_54_22]
MNQSVGIDVGKRELVASIRDTDGKTAIAAPFPNTSIGLRKLAVHLAKSNVGADDPVLLESTGPYHWLPARTLTDRGFFVKVANPLHTKQIARHSIRKRKTDKVDASHLAFLASQGYGYRFVETAELAKKKALVRHYWKLRSTATSYLLHERYLKEYRGVSKHGIFPLLEKRCEAMQEAIVEEWNEGNDLKYLDSIPGVSPFIAATILAELAPLNRFERMEQIVAFAGLDPSVKQSGGVRGTHGPISKRGSPFLRHALYLAVFGSFSHRPMNAVYKRYKERGLHHNAIMCVLSRKVLRIAIALLRKRRTFDPKFLNA